LRALEAIPVLNQGLPCTPLSKKSWDILQDITAKNDRPIARSGCPESCNQ